MTLVSATVTLILVMDPVGCIPAFLAILGDVDDHKRLRIVMRECLLAYACLLSFLFFGRALLNLISLSDTSLGIAGGIILFIIALRIIFPTREGLFGELPDGEPFLVPIAIPLIAGPSAAATVLLLASRWPERRLEWLLALSIAIAVSALVLSVGGALAKFFGKRGLVALERLMGLVLTAIAVEMFLGGIKEFVEHLGCQF